MDQASRAPRNSRTELTAYIGDLFDFIEDKIAEAEGDLGSRAGSLIEADGAFPVIRDRLLRGNEPVHAQLMLLGLFDVDFERLASMAPDEFAAATEDLRKRITHARTALPAD